MISLEKWQFISFLSRGVAMGLGIIQSFVILRILSVSDWGIAQLAVSIGASLGIYQHLGLASASNREIAAVEKDTKVFKIFFTTVSIRYLVTIPLSVGLFILAPKISASYGFEELVLLLRLYSIVLLIQGVQAILNAVISGTKRFRELFIFQGAIALASVIVYIPLVYFYGVIGYFIAMVILESIKSISLLVIALKPYLKNIKLPTKKEFISIFKDLFSLGLTIYVVKILVINWEKSGTNLLGFTQNAELLGIYAFSLLYAKKLMHVSDAVTDVNLPVFSKQFVDNKSQFKKLFATNFNKIFSIIVFFAMSAVFWAPELISILIGGNKYDSAIPLIFPMVFAFIFFSLINVIKSSVFIPAVLKKEMIIGFLILVFGTFGTYLVAKNFVLTINAMSLAMLLGSFASFIYLTLISQKILNFKFVNHSHFLILVQAAVVSFNSGLENLVLKILLFIVFVVLYYYSLLVTKFISKSDITKSISKLKSLSSKFKK